VLHRRADLSIAAEEGVSTGSMMARQALVGWLRGPFDDFGAAAARALGTPRDVLAALAAYAASWWLYVPVHELLHALGCVATGGSVTRLEMQAIYGAALLRRVFPFIVVGSTHAGRLTGFDTHGSDAIYLATDLAAFVPTVLVGVPLLRWSLRSRAPSAWTAAAFGAALPVALAPFLSITGDYYEIGSILVSRALALFSPAVDVSRYRSDDLFELGERLFASGVGATDVFVVTAALLVGFALALTTYQLGRAWDRRLAPRPRPNVALDAS
jgi:hypothetical protein